MADRKCPTCGQHIEVKVGLNDENFKKLFKKPTLQDGIILFMLIMFLAMAYLYKTETQACRDTIKDIDSGSLCGVNLDEDVETLNESELIYDYGNQTETQNPGREIPETEG